MDNHGLRKNVPVNYTSTTKFNRPYPIDILASFEFGGEWGTEYTPRLSRYRPDGKPMQDFEWRLRIAAFCDIGICNFNGSAGYLVEIPQNTKWDFCTFKMNHVLSLKDLHNSGIHNFYVGVKVTVGVGTKRYRKCVMCGEVQTELDMQNPYRKGY
jgi:hypothetical protein